MKPLKIGIGGVRGVVGETFTPELAVAFAQAFGTYLGPGAILVGRDTRASGPMVAAAVRAGLLATGCGVIDLGICPTPSLQLAVPWLEARGGISITAGHNDAEWNALKFVRPDGLYLNALQAEELLDVYHQGEFAKARSDSIHTAIADADAISHHLEVLAAAFDTATIRRRRPRVALDCCNGACVRLTPRWLDAIGCEVLAINDDADAPFPHSPEPRPRTMAQVSAIVRAGHADVGFVQDADGERIGIVDDRGRRLSEEYTLVLAAGAALARRRGPIVTNVCTTGLVDRVAQAHGVAVFRTPVGQPNISAAILEHGATIGGEGNGSVAVPEVQVSHDAAATMTLLLEHLARTGEPVSSQVDRLPALSMVKQVVPVDPRHIYSTLQAYRHRIAEAPGTAVDETDGVRLDWSDGWVHVRASGTESMVRVIAEASTQTRAQALADWARDRLGA
ncbi:MAG TPA: phosphoglucosamine mutase [Vicinamibacterales bacterium]|nr:phosphoglucosamine mutase [Vicinamibacterales bacterium]